MNTNEADRLKVAVAENATTTPQGNAAAMREALKNLTRFEESDIRQLETLAQRAIDNDIYGGGILQAITTAIREGKAALAEPRLIVREGRRRNRRIGLRHSAPCIIFQKVKDAIRALQFQQKALLHFTGMHVKAIGCRCPTKAR